MRENTYISVFLFAFLILTLLLRLFNFIQVDFRVLIGLYILLPGISIFYKGFEGKKRWILFTGNILFLSGLMTVFTVNEMIVHPERIIYPAALLIPGAGFLMLFLLETGKKIYLLSSVLLIASGLVIIYLTGNLSVERMVKTGIELFMNYWLVFVLVIIIILLSIPDKKKQ